MCTDRKIIDIVKIDNSFNKSHAFSKLNANEQNIAYSIFSRFSTGDNVESTVEELTIDSSEIRELSGVNKKAKLTKAAYRNLLERLRAFFLTSFFVVHIMENGQIVERGTPIFHVFEIINNGESVHIKLMPEAAHLFSKIFNGFGFTVFALKRMVAIPSPTGKNLYRLFLEGKHIYGWNATRQELMAEFGFSTNAAFSSFVKRLDTYMDEVRATEDFDFLGYELVRDKRKRGAPIVNIRFKIKINNNRLDSLVSRYKKTKPKQPFFKKVSVSKNSVVDDDIYLNADGIPQGRQKIVTKMVDATCPKCHGKLYAFVSQKNKAYVCCSNSWFWGLGNATCGYVTELSQDDRLTDDLKAWIASIKNTVPQKTVVDYLKDCEKEKEGQELLKSSKSIDNNSTDNSCDPDAPFPVG